jgi:hypothetical protein
VAVSGRELKLDGRGVYRLASGGILFALQVSVLYRLGLLKQLGTKQEVSMGNVQNFVSFPTMDKAGGLLLLTTFVIWPGLAALICVGYDTIMAPASFAEMRGDF